VIIGKKNLKHISTVKMPIFNSDQKNVFKKAGEKAKSMLHSLKNQSGFFFNNLKCSFNDIFL
jgi:hypothetical protein